MNTSLLKKGDKIFYRHNKICKIYDKHNILDLIYYSFLNVGSSFIKEINLIFDTAFLKCQFVLLVLCLKVNIQIFLF